jgi:hypothetical protein
VDEDRDQEVMGFFLTCHGFWIFVFVFQLSLQDGNEYKKTYLLSTRPFHHHHHHHHHPFQAPKHFCLGEKPNPTNLILNSSRFKVKTQIIHSIMAIMATIITNLLDRVSAAPIANPDPSIDSSAPLPNVEARDASL